ncbi:hypothetical protein [Nocardioides dongkuii]|uniref:hypothetical protein n=1 Tax=Nocardioides dongkuii TaxID=2760089 RepID=UPI0015F93156|nr:hypothetical protein [Nocardioides dongkuii]
MNSLIRLAALAAAALTTTAALATSAAAMVPAPEHSPVAAKPATRTAAQAPKAERIDFVRYCDDGGIYHTHKRTDNGPAFIEGTRDKFINVDGSYDGPRRVYTCGYIVLQDPTFTGSVQSIRVKR